MVRMIPRPGKPHRKPCGFPGDLFLTELWDPWDVGSLGRDCQAFMRHTEFHRISIRRFSGFYWFFNVFMGVFGGFHYFTIANFDSRTNCNTFWMISGTSKNVSKSGPSDPVFITKIFQKLQEADGTILEDSNF